MLKLRTLALVTSLLSASASLALGSPLPTVVNIAPTLAALRAIPAATAQFTPTVHLNGTTSAGDGTQGDFTWSSSSTCSDDAGQSCVKPTDGGATGRWVKQMLATVNGGCTVTGGCLWTGSIGQSTVNGVSVARTDAQGEGTNNGANLHPLWSLVDRTQECVSASRFLGAVTGSQTGTAFTRTGGITPSSGSILCGTNGSGWGSVAAGTTFQSGPDPNWTMTTSQTLGSATYYVYLGSNESSYGLFGKDAGGVVRTMGSINSSWASNNDTFGSGAAVCIEAGAAGASTVGCEGLFFWDGGVIIGATSSGGGYVSPGPTTTKIWQNLSVRGTIYAGTDGFAPQIVLAATSGQPAYLDITRNVGSTGLVRFSTASTRHWELGMDPALGFANDFNIYDPVNARTPFIIQQTTGFVGINTVNPAYQLDVTGTVNASAYRAGTSAGVDGATCSLFKKGICIAN